MLARMRAVANGIGGSEPARRVHVVVAIDRLLQRLLQTTSWGTWILKGGYANQVRHPATARTTEDVDLAIEAAIEKATEMLVIAMRLDLADLFAFELAGAPRVLAGAPGGGRRYMVIARLGGQELVRFNVDVSANDAVVGPLEQHASDPIVQVLGYERATYPVYPVAQQYAEKLHAYTVPREAENTRAKDLADMVWLATLHPFESDALIDAAAATFGRRASPPWPPALTPPPAAWARQYGALRRELNLDPGTVAAAHASRVTFLEPVLAGDRGRRWDPGTNAWTDEPTRRAKEATQMPIDATPAGARVSPRDTKDDDRAGRVVDREDDFR
jgi:predicted nucleotidyltransferase component of viral defense system